VTITYSNRTVHLCTGRVTPSHFYAEICQTLFLPTSGPPNSPDMNPVDYKIWAVMQDRVYEKRVNDVDELLRHSIGQNVIDEAIDPWRARLAACVRAKRGHFEHLMYNRLELNVSTVTGHFESVLN